MTEQPSELSANRGLAVDASDPHRLRHAIELALNYRGDVTVTLRSTGGDVEGYLYDRAETVVRMIPANGDDRVTIPVDDIEQLRFTGRDTAEGKSFETWMKKYVEKKLAGEAAGIEAEPLEE